MNDLRFLWTTFYNKRDILREFNIVNSLCIREQCKGPINFSPSIWLWLQTTYEFTLISSVIMNCFRQNLKTRKTPSNIPIEKDIWFVLGGGYPSQLSHLLFFLILVHRLINFQLSSVNRYPLVRWSAKIVPISHITSFSAQWIPKMNKTQGW